MNFNCVYMCPYRVFSTFLKRTKHDFLLPKHPASLHNLPTPGIATPPAVIVSEIMETWDRWHGHCLVHLSRKRPLRLLATAMHTSSQIVKKKHPTFCWKIPFPGKHHGDVILLVVAETKIKIGVATEHDGTSRQSWSANAPEGDLCFYEFAILSWRWQIIGRKT